MSLAASVPRPARLVLRLAAVALLTTVPAAFPGRALAHDRLYTLYDWRSGLDAGTVWGLAQDADGFIILATSSGILRFDGSRFDRLTERKAFLIQDHSETGPVFVGDEGIVKVLRGKALEPVLDPAGATIPATGSTWFDTTRDGSLWVVRGDGGTCYRPDGSVAVRPELRLGGPLEPIGPGRGDEVYAWADGRLLALLPEGEPRFIARTARPLLALETSGRNSAIVLTGGGQVRRDGGTGGRVLATGLGRPFSLVERGDAIWASFDTGLYRIGRDDSVERVGEIEEVPGGDGLLLDREGNLWMSSSWSGSGLFLFPEPETVIFRLGRNAFTRSVALAGGEPWFGAWWGSFRIANGPRGWEPGETGAFGWSLPAVDREGRVFIAYDGSFQAWNRSGSMGSAPAPGVVTSSRASPTASDGRWIPTDRGLFLLPPGADRPQQVLSEFPGPSPPRGAFTWEAFETGSGELVVSAGPRVCTADARAVEGRRQASWSCETVEGTTSLGSFAELPGLGLLAASYEIGVLLRRDGLWERLPNVGALRLDLPAYSLRPGEDGTLWMALEQDTVRIRAAPDRPEGYEIVERLSARNGMPHVKAVDLCDDDSGGLWLALPNGAAHIPAQARRRSSMIWPARLVEATVDGSPLATGASIELPYNRNRLELRFAALTFTDPAAVSYRMRLHAGDEWSDPVTRPEFRFVDLPSGRYEIAVQAGTHGARWQDGQASLAFRVLRPWYLQAWFFLLSGSIIALLAWAWHRMRVAALLRLEQQRARIAMDLHDEIGAGLGGIGLMAGLAARPDTTPERRSELSGRVAAIASSLASSLQDIVWSLRPGAARLESLASHIVDRGQALFADGSPEFTSEIPERLPAVNLSLPVRRDVLLIAQEAMHNARRHSGARHVRVRLEPWGRRWSLSISDDGTGIKSPGPAEGPSRTGRGGLGLESMRSRAREIGAELEWKAVPSGGTEVRLVFDPGAEPASHDRATRPGGAESGESGP